MSSDKATRMHLLRSNSSGLNDAEQFLQCGKSGRKLSYFGPSFGIEAIGGRRQAMTPKRCAPV
jgi:hypothetical protein